MAYTRKSFPMHKGTSSHKSAVKQKAMKKMALKRMEGTKEAFASGALLGGTLKKKAKKASDAYKKSIITGTQEGMSERLTKKKITGTQEGMSEVAAQIGKNIADQSPNVKKMTGLRAVKPPAHEMVHKSTPKTKKIPKNLRTLTKKLSPKDMSIGPEHRTKKTKMLKGTTIFGKTIPEIKQAVKNVGKKIKKANDPRIKIGKKSPTKDVVWGGDKYHGKGKHPDKPHNDV